MEKYDLKYFKKYSIEILKLIKEYINEFNNNIVKTCESLIQIIDNYIISLSKIDVTILHRLSEIEDNEYYKEFKDKYPLLNEINIKNNSLYKKIENEYNKIINFKFLPVKNNSFDCDIPSSLEKGNNTSNDPTQKSICSKFFGSQDLNDTNLNNNLNNYKCCKCGNNNANIIYQNKKDLYCKKCYESLEHIIDGKEINEMNKDQADKAYFLNSMINLIKLIILECDEIIKIKKDNNSIIKKKVEYYKMENVQDYFNFLVDINECIKGNVNIDKFNLANLNQEIREKINDLFKRNIDIKIDLDQEEYENDIESSGEIINEFYDENEQNEEKEQHKEKKEKTKLEENILNDFYYFINIVPKNNSKFNEETKNQIENKLKIKINPNNFIVSNNNKYFIDNFVRTDNFLKLLLGEIKTLYPNLEELYEYKNIVDYLIKECDIGNYIDCKGNFIIKINNKDKIKEKYYPPYEWIGIGIKFNCSSPDFNDNEWAIAYYGVGGRLPMNEVKDKLKDIIINGLEQGNSQNKWNLEDIRHPGKKIGTGVYLTPNINLVENYCGIIQINNEKYRVALMVKVKIYKIKEPKDINFWILNNKYIRPYRILLKKINKCGLN